jgi:hypothetical protein
MDITIKGRPSIERNHNKEALLILERKRAQLIIEWQSISSGYIPQHKFKNNFLDYYEDFVKKNLALRSSQFLDFTTGQERRRSNGCSVTRPVVDKVCRRDI